MPLLPDVFGSSWRGASFPAFPALPGAEVSESMRARAGLGGTARGVEALRGPFCTAGGATSTETLRCLLGEEGCLLGEGGRVGDSAREGAGGRARTGEAGRSARIGDGSGEGTRFP